MLCVAEKGLEFRMTTEIMRRYSALSDEEDESSPGCAVSFCRNRARNREREIGMYVCLYVYLRPVEIPGALNETGG